MEPKADQHVLKERCPEKGGLKEGFCRSLVYYFYDHLIGEVAPGIDFGNRFATHFRFYFRVCAEKGESTILLEKPI